MKVRELQEQLSKLDPELDVVGFSEDESFLVKGRGFIVLDVVAVTTTEVPRLRFDDGTPYLVFDKGSASTAIAALEVTSDF